LVGIAFLLLLSQVIAQEPSCLKEFLNGPHLASPLSEYVTSDFNLICFGNFNSKIGTGDIEGRAIVNGDMTLGNGFSIGYQIHTSGPNSTDETRPFSLVVGANLTWGSGALYPQGNGVPYPGAREDAFVGGTAHCPPYLEARVTGNCTGDGPNCLYYSFDIMYEYFRNVSANFSASPVNTQVTYQDSGAFVTTAEPNANRYYLQMDAAAFSGVLWWSFDNINPIAEFIITITGDEDVTFTGANFPALPAKTCFNIPGKKNINVDTTANGSVLGPDATLNQVGGDEIGFVVIGSVSSFVETRKPKCLNEYCCKYCWPETEFNSVGLYHY